jgi:hypothetical protein
MQNSATEAAQKTAAPNLPIQHFPAKQDKPKAAKINAKAPAATNPKLKRLPVKPETTPKSLKALLVQLN